MVATFAGIHLSRAFQILSGISGGFAFIKPYLAGRLNSGTASEYIQGPRARSRFALISTPIQ